jgi:hypothetical protein
MSVMSGTGENIEHFALRTLSVKHAIRGQQRQALRPGEIGELRDEPVFTAAQMTLHFDENILFAECPAQISHRSLCTGPIVARQASPHRAFFVASQRHKTFGVFGNFRPAHRRVRFRATQFSAGDEAAKISVPLTRSH